MARALSFESIALASARRPWRVVGAWMVGLAVAMALIATLLADGLTTEFTFTNSPDSKRADELLETRLRGPRMAREIVIVRSDTLTVQDEGFHVRVESLYAELAELGPEVVAGGTHYYQALDSSLASADGHTTLIPIVMADDFDAATDNIHQVFEITRRASVDDAFRVVVAGEASIAAEMNEVAADDLTRAEFTGVPVAFAILIVVFGTLVAALLPMTLTVFTIVFALGVTALIGQTFQLSFFVTNMITMIGLAVGIDYSLFIVSRFREERARGLEKLDAIGRAGSTATRAVFFSGVTVVVALFGMLIIPTVIFQSLGLGAILAVVAAVAASLTLSPAILSLVGDRVNRLRVPLIGRRGGTRTAEANGGFWDWVTRSVMRRPVVSLVIAAGILGAAAIPVADMKTGFNDVSSFPDGFETKEAFLLLEKEFSFGLVSPLEIVIDGDIGSSAVRDGIDRLREAVLRDEAFVGEPTLEANAAGDLALLSAPLAGQSSGDVAVGAVKRLRGEHIPTAFAGVPATVLVTGAPAFNQDFFELTDRFTPIVFAVVLGLSFVLLTIVFRSIVVPIKAILMNLLSVGAAYGLMVLVFQKGVGAGLLGYQQSGAIDAWIPLFLFTVLFGLSMDYHVFLLSRIRERYDQTGDNSEAVAYGLRSTAGLITGAALIMVAVFGAFSSGNLVMFQQVGFGLAVAILLDATIIRSVLVPATMRLLGNANWYMPPVLRWLPDLRVEREASAPAEASGE